MISSFVGLRRGGGREDVGWCFGTKPVFRETAPSRSRFVPRPTTGEEGLRVYETIVEEAARKRLPCAAILILSEAQASWAARVQPAPHSVVMVRPVTIKQLQGKLNDLMTASHNGSPTP